MVEDLKNKLHVLNILHLELKTHFESISISPENSRRKRKTLGTSLTFSVSVRAYIQTYFFTTFFAAIFFLITFLAGSFLTFDGASTGVEGVKDFFC